VPPNPRKNLSIFCVGKKSDVKNGWLLNEGFEGFIRKNHATPQKYIRRSTTIFLVHGLVPQSTQKYAAATAVNKDKMVCFF
jgi:hypothetical protein